MSNPIIIFFIDTDDFFKDFFQKTLEAHKEFLFTNEKSEAHIFIKIEDDVTHFYAKDSYDSLQFPCQINDFIQKIKSFFYNEVHENFWEYDGFFLKDNILKYDNQDIKLSDQEQEIVALIMQEKSLGIDKNILLQKVGTSFESALYRLRRKLSLYNIDIKLADNKFILLKE